MANRARIIAKEDRISNLPDDIIHRILSSIDMKYVIQTSALSKKWRHIWTSMPNLNLNSRTFRTSLKFVKFVNDALSHRNHRTEVSAVGLSFEGAAPHFDEVVTSIVNYAYSRNLRKLTIEWNRVFSIEILKLPQHLFCCHTLKHLTLTTNYWGCYGLQLSTPNLAWDFPALETLNLNNMKFESKSLNLFSKCVNLKDLTLHGCDMRRLDIFSVCAPRLSNLTITDPYCFPELFNVVAPKLESLTISVIDTYSNLLQLSIEDLDSLEKVNLSVPRVVCKKKIYASGLLDLFLKLRNAKFLILGNGMIKFLSTCRDQLLREHCPFNKLKCVKIHKEKYRTTRVPTYVINYFLEGSSSVAFIKDLPQVRQKRSREEVDEGTMQQKKSREEVDKSTMVEKALSPCTDRPSHEPSPRMPIEVNSQLLESPPSASFNMDLPQVPPNRAGHEAGNGTTASTLDKEKQQTKTMDEENRMLEAKIVMQDELIAEKKAKLEATKVQNEKRMLEEKILMQNKIIAHQKLEEKMQMQDRVIAEQKVMLETMRLQNEMKMFETKILSQDKIISEQKAMLEAMKLQQENIGTQLGSIDS